MSRMAAAMTWLSQQKKAWDAISVVYSRGSLQVTLSAWMGSVLLKTADGRAGIKIERTDRDFVFNGADLASGGIGLPPLREDVITVSLSGTTETFALLPYGPHEPVWRWVDGHETMIRVHTKQTA